MRKPLFLGGVEHGIRSNGDAGSASDSVDGDTGTPNTPWAAGVGSCPPSIDGGWNKSKTLLLDGPLAGGFRDTLEGVINMGSVQLVVPQGDLREPRQEVMPSGFDHLSDPARLVLVLNPLQHCQCR